MIEEFDLFTGNLDRVIRNHLDAARYCALHDTDAATRADATVRIRSLMVLLDQHMESLT